MTPYDIARRCRLAEQIAREAGALALEHFQRRAELEIESKRHPQDLVSLADRAVETLIRERLNAAFPEDAQLGEEYGMSDGGSGVTWVIDPIDGTAPYLAGLPGWCVSIGARDAEGPVVGLIQAPVLGETFVAMRGGGARLNGEPIEVTDRFNLKTGLLGIGANDRVPAASVGTVLAELTGHGASWVRYGSGALMLAYVAAGRLVGYAEPRMNAWDCMAAYCLVEEAGGRVLPFPDGAGLTRPAPVLAAAPHVYDTILRITRLEDDGFWNLTL